MGSAYFNSLDKFIRYLRTHVILDYIDGGTLLDVGCGRENYLIETLLDMDKISDGLGVDKYAMDTKHSKIVDLDQQQLSEVLKGRSFDYFTLLAVLEHLSNPKPILKNIYGMMETGSKLILTTPTKYSKPILEFLAFRLKVISENEIADHKYYYNLDEIEELMVDIGFKRNNIVAKETFEFKMNNLVVVKK